MIGMFSAVLSGVQSNVSSLAKVYRNFQDCTQYFELPGKGLK